MTVSQLRDYADAEGIDLGSATLKEDIVLAIMVAQEGSDPTGNEGEPALTQPELATANGPLPEDELDAPGIQGEEGPPNEIQEEVPVAAIEQAVRVRSEGPNWDLMPASVLEVLRARNMPVTTEALRAQPVTVERAAAVPEGGAQIVNAIEESGEGSGGGAGGSEAGGGTSTEGGGTTPEPAR